MSEKATRIVRIINATSVLILSVGFSVASLLWAAHAYF